MDSQGSADGIAEFTCANFIVLGKYLNSIPESYAIGAVSLHGHAESQCKVVDVDPAFLREKRAAEKNPEVTAPPARLQSGVDLFLPQMVLKLNQVFHGVLVVGVYDHPFASLAARVNCIETDGDRSFEVPSNDVLPEHQGFLRPAVRRTEVVMPPRTWIRFHGLDRIGPPVNKQPEVGLDDLGSCDYFRLHRNHLLVLSPNGPNEVALG